MAYLCEGGEVDLEVGYAQEKQGFEEDLSHCGCSDIEDLAGSGGVSL